MLIPIVEVGFEVVEESQKSARVDQTDQFSSPRSMMYGSVRVLFMSKSLSLLGLVSLLSSAKSDRTLVLFSTVNVERKCACGFHLSPIEKLVEVGRLMIKGECNQIFVAFAQLVGDQLESAVELRNAKLEFPCSYQ